MKNEKLKMKKFNKHFFKMIFVKKSFSIKSMLTLFTFHSLFFTPAIAGLTDFKTIEKAHKAYEAKEYTESKTLFKQLDTSLPQTKYDIGNAQYKSKNYDAAIKSYESAEGIAPAIREHNIGNSYFRKKKWEKAIESYEKALEAKEDEDTRFNLELAKKMKEQEEKKRQEQQQKQDQQNKEQKGDQSRQQNRQNKQQENKKQQQKQDQGNKNKQKKEPQKSQGQQEKQDQKGQAQTPEEKQQKPKKKEKKPKDDQQKREQEQADSGAQPAQMSEEEKQKAKEMKRLMKKMGDRKMPTMMYQMGREKNKEKSYANPW
ncbi:MAG: tetratricopeptide repeat protein [Sulfurimonas sp.]